MHRQQQQQRSKKTLGDSFCERFPFVWIIFFLTLHNILQFLQGFLTRSGSKLPIKEVIFRPIFFTDFLKMTWKTTEGLNKAITSFSEFKKGHREETKPVTWLVYYLHFVPSLLDALLFILASHKMMLQYVYAHWMFLLLLLASIVRMVSGLQLQPHRNHCRWFVVLSLFKESGYCFHEPHS